MSTCRSSAIFTISATSSWPIIPPAHRRSTNIASIPAMSVSRKKRIGSSAPSSKPRFATTRRWAAVRIGPDWGSLDQELLTHLMDQNARSNQPVDARDVTREAMVQSALLSAERAEEIGLPRSKIILSAKVSAVQDLIGVYGELARRSNYALHLGLTEAGMGSKGIVASSAAMGVLLQQGIGDTIRVSLTPEPNGDRTLEVRVGQELLQTLGLRTLVPLVAACPGCGRTTSTTFQELASGIQSFIRESMPEWKARSPGGDGLNVRG